jgi:transposase-like protein
VLLHLAPGSKEDTASCREFFHDLRRRGLPDRLLVVSDGAPGLIRTIEECFPRSARQRCLAHKLRNLQSKVPEDQWPEFKARAIACYQAASPALARMLRDTSRRPRAPRCRQRWRACRTTSKRALRISASHSRIGGRSAPPICLSGYSARSGDAARSSPTHSASAPCSSDVRRSDPSG